eukprot:TRINITY_DN6115_c0_g1_i20.p2 TRINITY_DN6115_c0_g1~~TRINITY_DN6115_c0_g1_i20.p2  ORF type:complete len:145 (+),score=32.70 TRINITY_DN6115_c0_g1_i20:376-810(+)
MGLYKITKVLMILGVSLKMDENSREIVTNLMISGFNDAVNEAGTKVTGGQSVLNPWVMIGGTAIAQARESEVIMPNYAEEGDILVLTKPIGTQIAVNLMQWYQNSDRYWDKAKEFISEDDCIDANETGVKFMSRLSKNLSLIHI